jgi:hypothetical protein
VPRFESLTERELDAAEGDVTIGGKAEFEVRREPFAFDAEPALLQLVDDVGEIEVDEEREHEAVMELRAPADEARFVWVLPEARHERPQQQLLDETHARMRRHLERAHLEQSTTPGVGVGRIQLVDAELGSMRVAGDVGQQVTE